MLSIKEPIGTNNQATGRNATGPNQWPESQTGARVTV